MEFEEIIFENAKFNRDLVDACNHANLPAFVKLQTLKNIETLITKIAIEQEKMALTRKELNDADTAESGAEPNTGADTDSNQS